MHSPGYAWKPQFKCVTCDGLFEVELPEEAPVELLSDLPKSNSSSESSLDSMKGSPLGDWAAESLTIEESKKDCPRCQSSVNIEYPDCPKCGVVFAHLDKNDPSLKVPPEMLISWSQLMENYQSRESHQRLILMAVKTGHVQWLADQYRRLKEAQGGEDKLGDAMVSDLYQRSAHSGAQQVPVTPSVPANHSETVKAKQSREKALWMVPYVMSGIVIVSGMIHGGHRNMIGLGMALMCLSYGVHSLFKKPTR